MYNIVRTEYPRHPLSPDATESLARVKIKLAKEHGASPIEQPQESGTAPVGTSIYIVRNDSPEQIQITLSGPEVIIEEIPECVTCVKFTEEPKKCPSKGPSRRITLKPGQYDVVVESISNTGVTPYQGSWVFRSGAEYRDCYYIVTRYQP